MGLVNKTSIFLPSLLRLLQTGTAKTVLAIPQNPALAWICGVTLMVTMPLPVSTT